MSNKTPILYKLGKYILGPIFKLYYNPKIIGKDNILKKGSIIIAGNHKHLYDQCLVILSTKRCIHYLAKKEYFDNKKVSWFFKNAGCISVDRSKKDENAKKVALSYLASGNAIGIFPEGTRNKTDKLLLDFKYGAVSLAQKSNSYIVPFAIKGDFKFRSRNLKIVYGKPFKVNDINISDANIKLYESIKKLLEEND